MKLVDEQIAKYEALDIPQTKRPDFDSFWAETMEKVQKTPLNVKSKTIEYPIRSLDVQDLTFEGLDGTEIRTWLILPPEAKQGKVPVVVCYHGAGGSRFSAASFARWTSMGTAVIAMDFRMQSGETGSKTGFTGNNPIGLFTFGITDKHTSYIYHVWTDALRCIELALATEQIDDMRICVAGGSQGGATSLAMAGLHPAVSLCLANVPSNCWLEKRLFDRAGGAANLAAYLKHHPDKLDAVCETLSYYDNINLAERITCPTMVSCGLKDPVCPAENVFAAYNKITAEKVMHAYPFGEHGGGGFHHTDVEMEYLRKKFFE